MHIACWLSITVFWTDCVLQSPLFRAQTGCPQISTVPLLLWIYYGFSTSKKKAVNKMLTASEAEVEGFKPPIRVRAYTGFRVQRIRSLCHTSLIWQCKSKQFYCKRQIIQTIIACSLTRSGIIDILSTSPHIEFGKRSISFPPISNHKCSMKYRWKK